MKHIYSPRAVHNDEKTIEEIKKYLLAKGLYPPKIKTWYERLDFEWFKQST